MFSPYNLTIALLPVMLMLDDVVAPMHLYMSPSLSISAKIIISIDTKSCITKSILYLTLILSVNFK